MNARLISVALALVVLAGCGGGSEGDPAERSIATPAPRAYTFEELKAALPSADEVDGGLEVEFTCPEDKDRCLDGPSSASVFIDLEAATPELTEKQANLGVNSVHVDVQTDPDEDAAKTQQAKRRTSFERYDGAYDIPREDIDSGGYIPAEKGNGAFEDASSGVFTGYRLSRTATSEVQGKYFYSQIDVRSGSASVTVAAILGADGRTLADAEMLASKVLADYLKRLG